MANTAKIDIKSLQFEELQEMLRGLGATSYRATQVADWLYKRRVESFEDMTDLPRALRGQFGAVQPRRKLP